MDICHRATPLKIETSGIGRIQVNPKCSLPMVRKKTKVYISERRTLPKAINSKYLWRFPENAKIGAEKLHNWKNSAEPAKRRQQTPWGVSACQAPFHGFRAFH
jgi:hypothetical protein